MSVLHFAGTAQLAVLFQQTHVMVGGPLTVTNTGYNLNVGPIGSLTPDQINGQLCRSVAHQAAGTFFVEVGALVNQNFWTHIFFTSVDLNWEGERFLSADATFGQAAGRSEWSYPFPAGSPFINGTTYNLDFQ